MSSTYFERQCHVLLDMHIPDWDERFLSQFDARRYAELCAKAGADGAMIYCNSHAGLCNWPAREGQMHGGLRGRDIVDDAVQNLHARDIAVCAYYSSLFNNWAYLEHPEWRLVPSAEGGGLGVGSRFGTCCLNNDGFSGFLRGQIDELAERYSFDAFFLDMLFWSDVCVCSSCHSRYKRETGKEIPSVVDWESTEWCRFQDARERWLVETFRNLRDLIKRHRDIPVFANSGAIAGSWIAGNGSLEFLLLNDLVGGDFADVSFPLFASVTPSTTQYMYYSSGLVGGASEQMRLAEQEKRAATSVMFGGQITAVDTVQPDGTLRDATYERLAKVFSSVRAYPPVVGAKPVVDIAVYWSTDGNMSFAENGKPIDQVALELHPDDFGGHRRSAFGALRILREARMPVGVVTRKQLANLSDYPVLVLPNVLRVHSEEVDAFRDYVAAGGRIYASGLTSLVGVDGTRHPDFLLSELFGCSYEGVQAREVVYIKPASSEVADLIAPLEYTGHGEPVSWFAPVPITALKVKATEGVAVLGTVALPYGQTRGTRDDQDWASIHTSPPWEDTASPALIRRSVGAGEVVYSALDFESCGFQPSRSALAGMHETEPLRALFVGLIRSLMPKRARYELETSAANMQLSAYDDLARNVTRLVIAGHDQSVGSVVLRLRPPMGRIVGVSRLGEEPIELNFEPGPDGSIEVAVGELGALTVLEAAWRADRRCGSE